MPEKDEKIDSIVDNKNKDPGGQPSNEVENLKEQLKKAQDKIAEQGKDLSDTEAFLRDAMIVANIIDKDPELQGKIRQGYQSMYGVPAPKPGDKQPNKEPKKEGADDMENEKLKEQDAKIDKTVRSQRDLIVTNFENSVGINKLSAEDQKEVRVKIEKYLNTFGHSVEDVPVENLNRVMNTAFKAINNEVIADKGTAAAYTNKIGAFGSIKPNSVEEGDENDLTGAQKEWAGKLGLDANKVKENWQKSDEELATPSKKDK